MSSKRKKLADASLGLKSKRSLGRQEIIINYMSDARRKIAESLIVDDSELSVMPEIVMLRTNNAELERVYGKFDPIAAASDLMDAYNSITKSRSEDELRKNLEHLRELIERGVEMAKVQEQMRKNAEAIGKLIASKKRLEAEQARQITVDQTRNLIIFMADLAMRMLPEDRKPIYYEHLKRLLPADPESYLPIEVKVTTSDAAEKSDREGQDEDGAAEEEVV